MKFRESQLAHDYLDGLDGLEIGGAAHNPFGLDTINVDYTDDMDTIFKQQEVSLCGEAMPVDIVASGDALPVPDKSVDFVVSSHVIEHFFDPIKALKEWERVATKYIYVICPKPSGPHALPSDREKPLTPLDELLARHRGEIQPPAVDTHEHYTRWTLDTFVEMCETVGLRVIDSQETDDKVGNGFAVVIDLQCSPA